jgi:hypothetical protein
MSTQPEGAQTGSFQAETAAVLTALDQQGVLTSAQLQATLGKSQPSVSRVLQSLGPAVVRLGSGRATRYARPQNILGLPARQPLTWVDETGRREPWGELTLLAGDRLHVQADGLDRMTQGELPWFLAPLRPQGFLGRLQAQQLAGLGFDANPERWSLPQLLFAAAQLDDVPGALLLGEPPTPAPAASTLHINAATGVERLILYDALAGDVARTLPAGSSAGGEQAKFLCSSPEGGAELVKFTPPRGTPFGERWHDLLQAEALALQVLAEQGIPCARSEVLHSPLRSYLVSQRFDRLATGGTRGGARGPIGRRHAVALDAVHRAFVGGPRQHWAATCQALAGQRRLPAVALQQVRSALMFGRLIGNTDMHFGNLSLWVERADLARGRFTLAPLYDMLPMRWRPDASTGALDLLPFDPDAMALTDPARDWALHYWERMAERASCSLEWRGLAKTLAIRIAGT